MNRDFLKIHSAVRRNQAESYILISLIAFASTVIITRAFLQLTGFPQVGNSVLHIAHALWGGLLLIVAAYLPLVFANRWAFQASALLGGIGIGLFIDEIGKFITQANDYFFAPALPLIYGFILLNVLGYLYFRQPHKENARCAMYHALEGFQDLIDGDLDKAKETQIKAHLAVAQQSEYIQTVTLANLLSDFLEGETDHLPSPKNGMLKRVAMGIESVGINLSRPRHRAVITIMLIGWLALVTGYITIIIQGGQNLDPMVLQWRNLLIGIQFIVGMLMSVAAYFWLTNKEALGLKLGISGFLVSLVALQLLYFYLSQFFAITVTLLQVGILLVMIAYRHWYLNKDYVI
jgi:hypothetical protein